MSHPTEPTRSTQSDDELFESDWDIEEVLKASSTTSTALVESHATSSTSVGSESASHPRATIVYTTSDFVPVPSAAPSLLPTPLELSGCIHPPSSYSIIIFQWYSHLIAAIIVTSEDFETWLSELARAPAIGHETERLGRAARDAQLLLALRENRRQQAEQIRRLAESRSLAIHLLRSPLVRHLSAAQDVNLVVQDHPSESTHALDASVISLSDDEDTPQSRHTGKAVAPRKGVAGGHKRRRSGDS